MDSHYVLPIGNGFNPQICGFELCCQFDHALRDGRPLFVCRSSAAASDVVGIHRVVVDFQTRTNALECLNRLIDSLDKMMILEELLPFLTEIQCSDVDIIMAIFCRFQSITNYITLHYRDVRASLWFSQPIDLCRQTPSIPWGFWPSMICAVFLCDDHLVPFPAVAISYGFRQRIVSTDMSE